MLVTENPWRLLIDGLCRMPPFPKKGLPPLFRAKSTGAVRVQWSALGKTGLYAPPQLRGFHIRGEATATTAAASSQSSCEDEKRSWASLPSPQATFRESTPHCPNP